MPRRLFLGLALAATVLAACGGSAGPVLTDPKEILTKAVEVAAATKTVHLQAELAGTFKMDLTGTGEGSALDLKGTSLSGDIDIANKKFKAALAVPALLGLTADFVVIGQDSWTRISLAGPRWQHSTTPPDAASAASDPQKAVAELKTALDKLATPPTKLPDEKCGDKDCYRVQVKLTSADLGPLASAAPGVSGDGTLDVWVERGTNRPVKLVVAVDAGDQGQLTATLTLSGYDASVSIDAPPADQVDEGSPAP